MVAVRCALLLSAFPLFSACSGASEGMSTTDTLSSETTASARTQVSSRPETAIKRENVAAYLAGEGARFTFHGQFEGKSSDVELELRAAYAGDERILYFDNLAYSSRMPDPIFGMGAFARRADGLYTAEVNKVPDDIEKLPRTSIGLMLAHPATVGAKATVSGLRLPGKTVYNKDETYEVAAVERVTVPAGTFDDCVKLTIETTWDQRSHEHATVWLAPGIGPVKVVRATGRIDELTKFTPPPAASTSAHAGETATAKSTSSAAAPPLSPEDKAFVDKLCAESTCAGPRARLELWRTPKGELKRVLYDGDRDRCTHPPRFIFEASGKEHSSWSLERERPREAPLDYERIQAEILDGLTKSQIIVCGGR
ncbi:MAG: hypothetical protein HOW73_22520 [Polyangiaceae bacterium]|nr:hypothetical protein [Polyangiaceae bacterium]